MCRHRDRSSTPSEQMDTSAKIRSTHREMNWMILGNRTGTVNALITINIALISQELSASRSIEQEIRMRHEGADGSVFIGSTGKK